MHHKKIFVDRRCTGERRRDPDPCKNLSFDLYHRKRRKCVDRRTPGRSLEQDYYAFFARPGEEKLTSH